MNIFIRELRSDHHNMARVLKMMRGPLNSLSDITSADYVELLNECEVYLSLYPVELHHVKENVLFDRLVEREESMRGCIRKLQAEHQALARQSQELSEIVRKIEGGNRLLIKNFINKSNIYIESKFRHMRKEEVSAFPVIEQKLTIDDWKIIIAKVPAEIE